MSRRPGLLSEISWFQVIAGALAAMTAAWIASTLGVGGTLIGAALGSFVVTITSAFYGKTLEKGRTLVVQTEAGTTIQKRLEGTGTGDIAEAFEEVEDVSSPVTGAEIVEDEEPPRRRLHWKTILATTLAVLVLSLGAMGAYELVTGNAYGSDPDNPRIGNPFRGGGSTGGDVPEPEESTEPTETPSVEPTPTPTPTASTPAPTATPTPTPTLPSEVPTSPVTPPPE